MVSAASCPKGLVRRTGVCAALPNRSFRAGEIVKPLAGGGAIPSRYPRLPIASLRRKRTCALRERVGPEGRAASLVQRPVGEKLRGELGVRWRAAVVVAVHDH
jgi:hypothetical protein